MQSHAVHQGTLGFPVFKPVFILELRKQQRLPAVKRVTCQPQPSVAQMNTDLMRSSRERFTLQQGPAFECLLDDKSRARTFAALWVDPHESDLDGMRREFCIYLEMLILRGSLHQGGIALTRYLGPESVCQG